ncbi:OmpA family protein [Pseudomonas sp. G11-1]|uniref:OmpA family protein n=2 Tax=Halopseudomonas bauzanensis TaxID=653930 RepID=A0A4U0YTN5_9GAMM|nr:OmpA family protein [Pseudomonas sp. G11-1]MCO5789670.1 OmpA family protein [Pseudomonas sp. G11-2]TKA92383.1 OmpA family protein [Halopseudomonas bauzanensis]
MAQVTSPSGLHMNSIKTLALASLVFVTACSSKQEVVQAPPAPSWAESRIVNLTSIAEQQGYEIEREGEQIRLLIPVDGNFHPKRTLLLPSGLVPLSKVAQALKVDGASQLTVVGHSDSDGSDELNKKLSMERAQAVASVLRLGGIERQRMRLSAMADNQPRADNASNTGRKLNRRVEIILTPYPTSIALAD